MVCLYLMVMMMVVADEDEFEFSEIVCMREKSVSLFCGRVANPQLNLLWGWEGSCVNTSTKTIKDFTAVAAAVPFNGR